MTRLVHALVLTILSCVLLTSLDAHLGVVRADDASDCVKGSGDAKLQACSRIIKTRRLSGKPISKENLATTYLNRGNFYNSNQQYDQAIADYDQAIKLDPKDAKHYVNRGNAHRQKGQYDQAIADFDQAIKLNPTLAGAYSRRGLVYHIIGQYDRAIADYNMAIELNPEDDVAYNIRGLAYREKGDFNHAFTDFSKAISLNHNNTDALNNRGNEYHFSGKYRRALMDYSLAVLELGRIAGYASLNQQELSGDHNVFFAKVLVNSGDTNFMLGNYDRAINDNNEAINLMPTYARAYLSRAHAYEKKLQRDKAIADFRKAIDLEPENIAATSGLERLGATP